MMTMRKQLTTSFIAAAALLAALSWCGRAMARDAAHPSLLFDGRGLGDIRERAREGVPKVAWQLLLRKIEKYIDPDEPRRLDPTLVGLIYKRQGELSTYLEELSFCSVLSEDDELGREAVALLEAVHAQRPGYALAPDAPARAELLRGVALAYDWAWNVMTEPERAQARQVIQDLLSDLSAKSTASPWGTTQPGRFEAGVCGGAMGLGALAIMNEADDPARAQAALDRARQLVDGYLTQGFGRDGEGFEGVFPAVRGLHNIVLFAEAMKLRGAPELTQHPALRQLFDWLVYEIMPEGHGCNALGSSWYGDDQFITEPYTWALSALDGYPPAGWFFARTTGGLGRGSYGEPKIDEARRYCGLPYTLMWYAPRPEGDLTPGLAPARHFRDRGLVYFRTGFEDANDVVVSLESRERSVGLTQLNVNHFTIAGYGAGLAIDGGSHKMDDDDGQAAAHNTILIDGEGQTQPLGGIDQFGSYAGISFAVGSAAKAYGGILKADRYLAMIDRPGAPPYLLMLDDIARDGAKHRYDWLLHTSTGSRLAIRPREAAIVAGNEAGMLLSFLHPKDVIIGEQMYGTMNPHPVLVASVEAVNPRFLAWMMPVAADQPLPNARELDAVGGSGLEIQWDGATDLILSALDAEAAAVRIKTDAMIAVVRDSDAEARAAFLLVNGTYIDLDGHRLVQLDQRGSVIGAGGKNYLVGEAQAADLPPPPVRTAVPPWTPPPVRTPPPVITPEPNQRPVITPEPDQRPARTPRPRSTRSAYDERRNM